MADILSIIQVLWAIPIVPVVVKSLIVISILFMLPIPFTYLERKIAGHIQMRTGPMRVGFHGILQPIADTIKLFTKEDIVPSGADKLLFLAAPFVALVPYMAIFVAIPVSESIYISSMNVGALYVLAIGGLSIYGFILGGWASNSKYALLGGVRASAQMISYEVAMGFGVIGVVMMAQSLNIHEIVRAQEGGFWNWNVMPHRQLIACYIFLIAGFAECNRIPFDLPEAEGEFGNGFHTEYSGMRYAFFAMAEYVAMVSISALTVLLFLGGWYPIHDSLSFIPAPFWFFGKFLCMVYLFMWTRFTWPRFRYDQLMTMGWKILIPLGIANVLITGFFIIDF